MTWIIIIVVLVIIGFILDREIYFYEGAHLGPLGPRVQTWLYDSWARKYDESKHASQMRDGEMLAQPLLAVLKARSMSEPFILDFATGTGRLSHVLLNQPGFMGRIIAIDLSQGMLEQAASKLSRASAAWRHDTIPLSTRVELLRHRSLPLPFPDAAFDVVCALEVLELFPNMDEPLAELTRVLRPGGVLLTSRGTEESGRKAKVKSATRFTSLLQRNGFENVQITKWWELFDRVTALKNGSSSAMGARTLSEVLCCRACGQVQWQKEIGTWRCRNCGYALSVTSVGIVLN
jgi:ubiquinone/menaquinone biosynthesis C-methylase UbiE